MSSEKQYIIEIRGNVQMVGFRNFVESNALNLGLGGVVFNDRDGSVKILCEGAQNRVKTLVRLMEVGAGDIGAGIRSIKETEIPVRIPLPPTFFKEPTAELRNIRDKLDEGVEILIGIDKKLDKLDGIEAILVDIKKILQKMAEK